MYNDYKIEIVKEIAQDLKPIMTDEAMAFVAELHRRFNPQRLELLNARAVRQTEFDAGKTLDFLPETADIRRSDWKIAPIPGDLRKRWVEITGPTDRKMMINALNSGATGFMADLEDSLSPTWENVVRGQLNLFDAVRKQISFENPNGKSYKLNEETAVLIVRPRGWHMAEKHVHVDGEQISASLFDIGLYFFHNAHELLRRGTAPYFYLPKLESHREARLWAEIFAFSEAKLRVSAGSIRATVLIETLPAAFEMDEILFELRDHIAALNAGRWDYIFSFIKKQRNQPGKVLPDRSQVTMTVPFMRAYTQLLAMTCRRRDAQAIGGMAAFIPSRKDAEINERAIAQVQNDKLREVSDGFVGTWVAHPDLVPVAMTVFADNLGKGGQSSRPDEETSISATELLNAEIPDASITEAGLRSNINVSLQYLDAWLNGNGAAAIHNVMEDVATAEIARTLIWQWIWTVAKLEDGREVTIDLYQRIRDEEVQKLTGSELSTAIEILDKLVLREHFTEFLTLEAYKYVD